MAVRYRKYFKECKTIQCAGKRSRQCPETPKRSIGEYRTCGVWCVEFFDDHKVWQSLTFKDIRNKTDAEKRLAMFIGDRERGRLNLPKRRSVPTLASYCKTYLELHRGAKENTLAMKKRAVNVLAVHLGDYSLDKITPFVIEKFRVTRREQDGVKDSVINIDIQVLSHIFNTAISAGIIDRNPCQNIKRLKVAQTKDRILSSDEIATVLSIHRDKDRLMILTSLLTGARLNEVLSLKWQDVDFGRRIIHITQSKTGKILAIPLSEYLAHGLSGYKAAGNGGRIFEGREIKHKVVCEYSLYFSNLFKGLGIHGVTFHTLRHTFSSLLQSDLGIGATVVQGMTGHSSLSMLQKYSHTGLSNKQQAIEALTNHIMNAGKEKVLSIAQ